MWDKKGVNIPARRGSLVFVSMAPHKIVSHQRRRMITVQCDCGVKKDVQMSGYCCGYINSCGCAKYKGRDPKKGTADWQKRKEVWAALAKESEFIKESRVAAEDAEIKEFEAKMKKAEDELDIKTMIVETRIFLYSNFNRDFLDFESDEILTVGNFVFDDNVSKFE
jgi:hypothetical protein